MDWLIVAIAVAVIAVIVATTVLAVRDRNASPTLGDEAFDTELAELERRRCSASPGSTPPMTTP